MISLLLLIIELHRVSIASYSLLLLLTTCLKVNIIVIVNHDVLLPALVGVVLVHRLMVLAVDRLFGRIIAWVISDNVCPDTCDIGQSAAFLFMHIAIHITIHIGIYIHTQVATTTTVIIIGSLLVPVLDLLTPSHLVSESHVAHLL